MAAKFGVEPDGVLYSSGLSEPELLPGQVLQIPLCEVYRVASGNTLYGIAQLCQVGLDELIAANKALLGQFSPDAPPFGYLLVIPARGDAAAVRQDCAPGLPRQGVIEHTVAAGEGLFCLAHQYNLSTSTILHANLDRISAGITSGLTLVILPADGTLYQVTARDVAAGVAPKEIARWYGVQPEALVEWSGATLLHSLGRGAADLCARRRSTGRPVRVPIGSPGVGNAGGRTG